MEVLGSECFDEESTWKMAFGWDISTISALRRCLYVLFRLWNHPKGTLGGKLFFTGLAKRFPLWNFGQHLFLQKLTKILLPQMCFSFCCHRYVACWEEICSYLGIIWLGLRASKILVENFSTSGACGLLALCFRTLRVNDFRIQMWRRIA